MNNVSIFKHEKFGEIRVVDQDGEPWFVAKDVCDALGYIRARDAVSAHCKGGGEMPLPSAGGEQMMKIIPEADLYRLIMRSKLPDAERFQDWVVEEVLPSIRKHGAYMTPGTITEVMQRPENLIALVEKLHGEMTKRIAAEERIALDAPKVALADSFLTEGEDISMADLAKKLKHEGIDIGQNRLYELLRTKGVLIRRPGITFNTPTQPYMDKGWFKLIAPPPSMTTKWRKQIRITPKGVLEISRRMHELFGADFA